MGIRFSCPNGHKLNVKESYAGRRCYCPACSDKVVVVVPTVTEDDLLYRDFTKSILGPGESSSISEEFEFYDDESSPPPKQRLV